MRIPLFLLFLFLAAPAFAQFAPQAGQAGTTAVHRYSGSVSRWATGCRVIRGLQHIAQPSLGYASVGDSSLAAGMADGTVVSLGDSGIAILTFGAAIADAPGADIAVFENGFINPQDPAEAFIEAAFVEISSDGTNFFRFPAQSNTQDTAQIAGAGTYMDASRLQNLAGKYAAPYGTPFDFNELAGTPGLDLAAITHLRIVDVIGRIGTTASLDVTGHPINDPYPTPFPSGGFDLDAVAVLHGNNPDAISESAPAVSGGFRVFPNPATSFLTVRTTGATGKVFSLRLKTVLGQTILEQGGIEGIATVDLRGFPRGVYSLTLEVNSETACTRRIVLQ